MYSITEEDTNLNVRLRYTKSTDYVRIGYVFQMSSGRRRGNLPYRTNPKCSSYFGVYVAETVLSKIFKNVKRMPMNNPGYDFICNHEKKIDVKAACLLISRGCWTFPIRKNTKTDFFLLVAFDNRRDLNPQHIWLIPAGDINDHTTVSISETRIQKWGKYALDINKVSACCNKMKAV